MNRLACLIAAALISLPGAALGQDHHASREMFLKSARVTRTKDVGEGVTKPLKVYLKRDGIEMKAIFKDIDTLIEQPSFYNGEPSDYYIDSYKAEIAAYELDKALGFGLLPAIVERKVKRRTGSLREWIDDVMPRFTHTRGVPDPDDVDRWTHTVWLLDYLIYNVDRGAHNVMIGSDWSPLAIDNSMCFNTYLQPIRPLSRFPKRAIDRLKDIDRDALDRLMTPWLRPVQTDALWKRAQYVLQRADSLVAERGEAAVYFEPILTVGALREAAR